MQILNRGPHAARLPPAATSGPSRAELFRAGYGALEFRDRTQSAIAIGLELYVRPAGDAARFENSNDMPAAAQGGLDG